MPSDLPPIPGFEPLRQQELEVMGYVPMVDTQNGMAVFVKTNHGGAPFVEYPSSPTWTSDDFAAGRFVAYEDVAGQLRTGDAVQVEGAEMVTITLTREQALEAVQAGSSNLPLPIGRVLAALEVTLHPMVELSDEPRQFQEMAEPAGIMDAAGAMVGGYSAEARERASSMTMEEAIAISEAGPDATDEVTWQAAEFTLISPPHNGNNETEPDDGPQADESAVEA